MLINLENLAEFANGLWNKVKQKVVIKDEVNVFTGRNTFKFVKPNFEDFDEIMKVSLNSTSVLNSDYYVNYDNYVNRDTHIGSLAIPIYDSEVGQVFQISVFAVDSNTKECLEVILDNQDLSVTDYVTNGQNSIVVPIDKSYNQDVSFGFRVVRKTISGKLCGLMFERSGTTNSTWYGSNVPTVGQNLTPTQNNTNKIAYTVVSTVLKDFLTDVRWGDLDHTLTITDSTRNLFLDESVVYGQYYESNNTIKVDSTNTRGYIELDCKRGDRYTLFKEVEDVAGVTSRFVYLNEQGNVVDGANYTATQVNGWYRYQGNVINNDDVTKIRISVSKNNGKVMIFKSLVDNVYDYIPNFGDASYVIDSNNVAFSFDGEAIGMVSNTVNQAIKEQHQTLTSNISTITQNIDTANQNISNVNSRVDSANSNITSNTQRIAILEGNVANKGSENTFTARNTFMERSPIVEKYFSIKNISADGSHVLYSGGTYCCNPKEGITTNELISAILVPIHNSMPGDTIQATCFTFNASNYRLTSNISSPSTYTVRDIQYKGEYCIVFEVNRTFNYPVGFGFRVDEKFAGSRRIGLLKQDLPNQVSNNAWSSYNPLSIGESVSLNSKFMIPYAITRRASSEVVTRFDLANNTVPTGNYRVGELKMLVYDAGESTEIGGYTWLRCDGQTVSSSEYDELYDTIGSQFNTSSKYTIRPVNEDGTEVSVDFNLPTNQSNVGYLYICAK